MVSRPNTTRAHALWFALNTALRTVSISYRKASRLLTEAERHKLADDTIAELRKYHQWSDLDGPQLKDPLHESPHTAWHHKEPR